MSDGALQIFLSYAREDAQPLAVRLRDDLRAAGHAPWLDLARIRNGASWERAIEGAIEGCDIGLTLISKASFNSHYCRSEQARLKRKNKRIIPILVQSDADMPLTLETLHYIDFSDADQYDARLRDLLSDLNAGRAFDVFNEAPDDDAAPAGKSPFPRARASRLSVPEKRDAPAFRRHLAELRRQPWLGSRAWWTYFGFYYADIARVADALNVGKLTPDPTVLSSRARSEDSVRLFFRPRTPELYNLEGIRPGAKRSNEACEIPVYLLFDLESVICLPEARFSAGDPAVIRQTMATSGGFAEMPFEQIYHDGALRPEERSEILQSRRAQILVPDALTLESLQVIWCRSEAESELLVSLLSESARTAFGAQVTARADLALFHRRGAYVDQAFLDAGQVRLLMFSGPEAAGFNSRLTVDFEDGQHLTVEQDFERLPRVIQADLPEQGGSLRAYRVTLILDDVLAYQGAFTGMDRLD
jgi:hypothetical protein